MECPRPTPGSPDPSILREMWGPGCKCPGRDPSPSTSVKLLPCPGPEVSGERIGNRKWVITWGDPPGVITVRTVIHAPLLVLDVVGRFPGVSCRVSYFPSFWGFCFCGGVSVDSIFSYQGKGFCRYALASAFKWRRIAIRKTSSSNVWSNGFLIALLGPKESKLFGTEKLCAVGQSVASRYRRCAIRLGVGANENSLTELGAMP